MRTFPLALLATMSLILGGCEHLVGKDPTKPAIEQAATRSSACVSLDNFFLANIGRQWSAGIGFGGAALSGSRAQIVEYERLSDDESKKQMALAAVACELFQTGQLGKGDAAIERYQALLDQGLNAGIRAEALKGEDANRFLNEFKQALSATTAQARAEDKEQFQKLTGLMEQTVEEERQKLPRIMDAAEAARKSADAARDYAMQTLKADAGALQQLTTLGATVDVMKNDIDHRFNVLESAIVKFKAKWGITDVDPPDCSRRAERMPFYFGVNRRGLDNRSSETLSQWVSDFVKSNPGCQLSAHVEAFTDPSGVAAYNQSLSQDRAHSAAKLVRAAGIATIDERGSGTEEEAPVSSVARVVRITLRVGPLLETNPAAPVAPVAAAALPVAR